MAVKHSTQDDISVRLIILLRCDDTTIHGLEELESELTSQPVVRRPVWTTRDYYGIHLDKSGPKDAIELGILIARRYENRQIIEFVMRRDDGWSPRKWADSLDDLSIEPLLRPIFASAAEAVSKLTY